MNSHRQFHSRLHSKVDSFLRANIHLLHLFANPEIYMTASTLPPPPDDILSQIFASAVSIPTESYDSFLDTLSSLDGIPPSLDPLGEYISPELRARLENRGPSTSQTSVPLEERLRRQYLEAASVEEASPSLTTKANRGLFQFWPCFYVLLPIIYLSHIVSLDWRLGRISALMSFVPESLFTL